MVWLFEGCIRCWVWYWNTINDGCQVRCKSCDRRRPIRNDTQGNRNSKVQSILLHEIHNTSDYSAIFYAIHAHFHLLLYVGRTIYLIQLHLFVGVWRKWHSPLIKLTLSYLSGWDTSYCLSQCWTQSCTLETNGWKTAAMVNKWTTLLSMNWSH